MPIDNTFNAPSTPAEVMDIGIDMADVHGRLPTPSPPPSLGSFSSSSSPGPSTYLRSPAAASSRSPAQDIVSQIRQVCASPTPLDIFLHDPVVVDALARRSRSRSKRRAHRPPEPER